MWAPRYGYWEDREEGKASSLRGEDGEAKLSVSPYLSILKKRLEKQELCLLCKIAAINYQRLASNKRRAL